MVILLLGLSACQTVPAPATPAPAPAPPAPTTPVTAEITQAERINTLLRQAGIALDAMRLTSPDDDNAYLRYMQVLSLDPDNAAALHGLSVIVEQYLAWSINHIDTGNLRQARSFLMTAQSVDPNHANIAAVENRLDARRRASLVDYAIDLSYAGEPAPQTLEQLARIAAQIQQDGASVVIFAPTDVQGRRIYQRLNAATEERIRARFELSDRPRVRLIIPQGED